MVASLLLASCGSSAPVASRTTTTALASTSTSTTAAGHCSAAGLSSTLPAEAALPAPVSAMRSALARAAVSCDWAGLASLVDRNGRGLRFSFGAETDPVAYWKAEEERPGAVSPMRALRLLLGLHPAAQAIPGGAVSYTWPAAFASEHPTQAELQEVASTGLYTMATLNGWVQGGSNYLGYRVTIMDSGDWTLFVSGD